MRIHLCKKAKFVVVNGLEFHVVQVEVRGSFLPFLLPVAALAGLLEDCDSLEAAVEERKEEERELDFPPAQIVLPACAKAVDGEKAGLATVDFVIDGKSTSLGWCSCHVLTTDYELLTLNWLEAQTNKCLYLMNGDCGKILRTLKCPVVQFAGNGNAKDPRGAPQHGEVAHSIRHLLRNRAVLIEGKRDRADDFLQAFTALGSVLKRKADKTGDNTSGEKLIHSDLHHAHINDSPCLHFRSLCLEACTPWVIAKIPGYDKIEAEALAHLTPKGAKAPMKFDIIYWHRAPSRGGAEASEGQLKLAITEATNACKSLKVGHPKPTVLLLGDEGCKVKHKFALTLPSVHFENKNQLEQLMFMSALVRLSGAKIVTGIRSGLIDKISLTGSISCCQLAIGAQDRLDQVLVAGCAMGRYADVETKGSISTGMLAALSEHLRLIYELRRFDALTEGPFAQGLPETEGHLLKLVICSIEEDTPAFLRYLSRLADQRRK